MPGTDKHSTPVGLWGWLCQDVQLLLERIKDSKSKI